MSLSVIIPTLNSSVRLGKLLGALACQTLRPNEVLVADSSSSDGTAGLAASMGAEVIAISGKEFDHGGTRSLAGSRAHGEILLYMTDDCFPAGPSAIENLLVPFADAAVAAVFGRQLPRPDAGPIAAHLRYFNYPEKAYVRAYADRAKYGIKTPFLSNAFCAYRRAALEKAGWFKSRLILGEDTYTGAKLLLAGYKLAYAAEAKAFHSHDYTPWQEFKRYFDIGVFHESEKWILDEFGKAEGEGRRYITSGLARLISSGLPLKAVEFLFRAGLKFAAYRLGRNHAILPVPLVGKLSMHPEWRGWRKASGK